jgi:hypothetical protein
VVLLIPLLPFGTWAWFVTRRARRSGIGDWG